MVIEHANDDNKNKVLSLYKYLKDLCSFRLNTITNINKQEWQYLYKNIPEDNKNIFVFYRDRVIDDSSIEINNNLIVVHKPEFEKCPIPPNELNEWLESGWDNYQKKISLIEKKTISKSTGTVYNYFNSDKSRVFLFDKWKNERDKWVEKQLIISKTREFFNTLYTLHIDLERDSESFELMLGNGMVYQRDNKNIKHPILLKRVSTEFDSKNNTIKIVDTEIEPELYTSILNNIDSSDINFDILKEASIELKEQFYHPLDRNNTYDYLETLTHKLSSYCKFISKKDETINDDDKIFIKIEPVLFLRKRIDGSVKTIEQIIENIEKEDKIPPHILELVNGGKREIENDNEEPSITELLASTSGESEEILLAKEANKEQLEIAKRIEKYNAVLVQGPPGTGKTHTIANLLGHFLAQGKNVLVTSHTQKALKVLKDKVPLGLQNLCVSLLDDKNIDMEKSIDGITEYMSMHTSFELKNKITEIKKERSAIINQLTNIRKKIYNIRNKEFDVITCNGKGYSPLEAAKFISNNNNLANLIPGNLIKDSNGIMPLTMEELSQLYSSNIELTKENEDELDICKNLTNLDFLFLPIDFDQTVQDIKNKINRISKIQQEKNVQINYNQIKLDKINIDNLNTITNLLKNLQIDSWKIEATIDGKKGGNYREKWLNLIKLIEKTVSSAETLEVQSIGKKITYKFKETSIESLYPLKSILEKMVELLKNSKKLSLINKLKYKNIINGFRINGKEINSFEDCIIVIKDLDLKKNREELNTYLNSLIIKNNYSKFKIYNKEKPEEFALSLKNEIIRYINFNEYCTIKILKELDIIGFDYNKILNIDELTDTEFIKTKKLFKFFVDWPYYFEIINNYTKLADTKQKLQKQKNIIQKNNLHTSTLWKNLIDAIDHYDTAKYKDFFNKLNIIYNKQNLKNIRQILLNKINEYAPEWAFEIKQRKGIHGLSNVPNNIEEAWKYKYFENKLEELHAESLDELQKQNILFGKKLRQKTLKLCEYSAWYHLLLKTEAELDIQQALQGWKQTIKKIGKGTGKNAPMYRREAKKLMTKCQKSVPVWIMPIYKALETLKPGENIFDVIIVDEASQSDVTALSIVYMGKKVIIVGDDNQVSPMAIGINNEKLQNLINIHIKNVIPISHLYEANSSLYDIVGTTFQPLMLKEHFRCVPQIIGFSNKLSYDYKIKPLREANSSILCPPTISYKVDGQRIGKINNEEALTIVSLIKACIELPEYKNSTIGVISLLGKEQAIKIQSLIQKWIDITDIEHHKILCGDASSFQGDERDVMFLSIVDSNEDDGILKLASEGAGQSRKQRYNVAASRAKDQMWVIHSLDLNKDLQCNDLRKQLLEYVQNPDNFIHRQEEIREKADSPFEEEVCSILVAKGYNIKQQWAVGAYRIDLVICYKDKKIAIECDGEMFHSSEEKIRKDMERQTILERLGWQFIRIRGSEFYKNKNKAIEYIIQQLNEYNIYPESSITTSNEVKKYELVEKIKIKALQIRDEWDKSQKTNSNQLIMN